MSSFSLRSLTIWIIFGYVNYTEAGLLDNILGDNNRVGNSQLLPLLTQNNNDNNNRNSETNTNLFPNNNINSGRYRPTINNNGRPAFNNNYNRPIVNQGNLQNEKQQLEGLLGRLKEMNRLKEQREKEAQNQNGSNNPDDSSNVDDVSKPGYNNKPRPVTDNKSSPGVDEIPKNNNGVGNWKTMTKSKVAFQAQPVIPENEIKGNSEIIHYLE